MKRETAVYKVLSVHETSNKKRIPFLVTMIYVVFGGLWILLSDRVLIALVNDPSTLTQLQTLKGWFFVIVTGGLLYLIINRYTEAQHNSLVLERALRLIDTTLLQEKTTEEILGVVCDAVVVMGYRMCWVGLPEPDYTVRPATSRGFDDSCLSAVRIRWDDTPEGRGPTGRAIRTGKTIVNQNVEQSTDFMPWMEEARRCKYRSSAAVPLKTDEKVLGALNVYHQRAGAFTPRRLYALEVIARQATITLSYVQKREDMERLSNQNNLIINSVSEGIYGIDLQGNTTFVNPVAVSITGYAAEELIGRQQHDILHHSKPDGTHYPREECKIYAALRDGTVHHVDNEVFWRKDGTSFPVEYVSAPIRERGEIVGAVVIFKDITRRKRAEERLYLKAERAKALAEVSRVLAEGGLEYQAVLDTVARQMAELIGDTCVIHLQTDDGQWLNPVAFYHTNSEEFTLMRNLLATAPISMEDGFLANVIHKGQPLLIPVVSLQQVHALTNREYWSHLERLNIYSLLSMPLCAQGRVFGILSLMRNKPGHTYTAGEQVFLEDLANRLALTIANARLFKNVQRSFERIQALRNIDRAITASLDLRVTFNIILDHVTTQLSVHATDILLLNPDRQILEYAAGRGFRTKAIKVSSLRVGEGCAGRTALERRIVNITNLHENADEFTRCKILGEEDFVAYYGVPLIAKGQVKGVLEIFQRTPLNPDPEWLEFLETLAGQAAIAMDNVALFDSLQRSNMELTLAYDATIEGWSFALDLRDKETEGHSKRVTETTVRLARAIGMNEAELVHVRRGALLHDIGKMGVPDNILLKPGPLTDEELEIMKRHPFFAYEMLSPINYLRPALDIPYGHHEKWDGTGYPHGLKHDQIPLAARIFAVVDVWDALRSERPYRPAWPEKKVHKYIRGQAGKHFEPKVVELFLEME